MKYREKLIDLIFEDDENAIINWIESMPLLEQPDIFREFDTLVRELAAAEGRNIEEEFPDFSLLTEFVDHYEDKILDEKLAEANLVMAQQELDKEMLEVDEAVSGVREYVMDCIVNNDDNADAMRELAAKMIQSEKENDIFDPNNWSRIL